MFDQDRRVERAIRYFRALWEREGCTLEEAARRLGWEYDGEAAWLPGYLARAVEDATVYYPEAESEREAAEEYASAYPQEEETYWVTVHVWRVGLELDEDGQLVMCDSGRVDVRVTREPLEPPCVDDDHEHEWQSPFELVGGIKENPGCWGHGGGVIIREVCRHCGRYRITDTWATDPATGRQGLRSTRYEPADERSIAWAIRQGGSLGRSDGRI